MKTISNYVNKIINIFTTIIIILLLISVIASFQTTFFGKKYNSFFGYALFEIKTASMAGEMEIGDWIIVEITDDVNLNDIVTFEQDGAFITHRIIEQYKDTYVTKGDSNNSKDTPIKKEQIVGKMVKVMPKFGIIKKTFFNTKVLIVLIITILVGSSLIDKNNKKTNKKTNIKKEKNINKKPKEQDVLINIEQNNIDLNEETIDIIEKTIEKQQSNIKEDELSNTMVLSKIVVEMNSKTLAAISKKFEDTKAIDIVENNEQVQKEKEPKIPVVTNKKKLLGKNEKNLIRKVLELKENEILELSKSILEKDNLDSERKSIINKFINLYIEYKYINQGELNKECGIIQFKKNIDNNILLFSETLIDENNTTSYNNKIKEITNVFILINKLDSNLEDIETIIEKAKNVDFQDKKNTVRNLKKIIKQFNTNLSQFYKKLETEKFSLIIKNINNENIYKTNITTNIKFNKLFSNYSIDKTYNNEVIMENLRELQLKMLSLKILQDMFDFSYKKKYLIYLNDSIYEKEKKIKTMLNNINDIYSQGKINILLDIKTLIMNYTVISELKKNGYKFAIELEYKDLEEIKNIRKYLCVGEYLFIKNTKLNTDEILEKLPYELENKVVVIEKSLIEGPVIK